MQQKRKLMTATNKVTPQESLPPLTPETKATYVNRMFARIAPRYDFMNRLMTFGLDQGWRREVARLVLTGAKTATSSDTLNVLDVATGTGDIAIEVAKRGADAVVASDFVAEMMLPGPAKATKAGVGDKVRFEVADAMALPYGDDTFVGAVSGFAMRNVVDIEKAFSEMRRVVKPGGKVVNLEVARPTNPLVRVGHAFYFNRIVPILGRLLTGQAEAYTYLPNSAKKFPPPDELAAIMRKAGLRDVSYKRYGFGAVAIHVGTK